MQETDGTPTTTPYTRSVQEQRTILSQIAENTDGVYLNSDTNPDLDELAIYKLDSNDPRADLGRTFEADTFSRDAGYTKEFIEQMFGPYDGNSIFLMLVDRPKAEDPEVVGMLRIIDCSKGDSETISMFKEFYGEDTPLPAELAVEPGEKVWDIFTVAIDPKYRDGKNSAWLYHALYRLSLEQGVDRWLSNITPKEIRNLRDRLGIPFEDVPGVDPVFDETPDGHQAEYGFYYAKVSELGPAVAERISLLKNRKEFGDSEKDRKIGAMLMPIASIALNGSVEHETA